MANPTHYDVGDVWVPQATFQVGGVNTDPTHITVVQQDPSGAETTISNNTLVSGLTGSSTPVAKTATGILKLNPGITLTSPGYWFVKFTGDGTAAAAETQQAVVDPDEFSTGLNSRALVGLAETRDWLQSQGMQSPSDLDLIRVINDVSDRIYDESGGREFKPAGTNPETRIFDVDCYGRYFYLDADLNTLGTTPAIQFVSAVDWSTVIATVANTDVTLRPIRRKSWEPARSLQFSYNVTSLSPMVRVKVTGNWGFPSVPGSIRQAALDAIADIMDRDVEHYSQDLAPDTGGGEANVIVLGSRPQILSLPPAALAAARSFRLPLVA